MKPTPAVPHDVRSLAIEMPSWVGDTVMATPLLRAAREARPEARITGIMRPGLDDVLAGTPFLDEMIAIDPRGRRGIRRLARSIRTVSADAVLLLPNSVRSGLAARLSGTRVRVGYARDGRGPLLTHGLAFDRKERPLATIEYYARLAKFAIGLNAVDLAPELSVTDGERAAAKAIVDDVDRLAVLNPGGNKPAKRWPAERFAKVADHLAGHGKDRTRRDHRVCIAAA